MKIARLPSKKKNIILIIALIIGLPILSFAAYQAVQYISNASADTKPQNIILSNLTTSSVTITWTTDSQTLGSVSLVEDGTEQSPVVDKRGDTKRYTHYVELTSLEPNTSYDFLITSNTTKYTSVSNTKFTFKTAPITSDTPTPNPIVGTVSGVSSDDVIVFATLKDKSVYPVSATMPSGGNWIIDLSAFRKVSDMSLLISNSSTNLVIVAVSGGGTGAELSGMYSELFDSNGKLNSTKTLSVTTDSTLYSYFPSEAELQAADTGTDSSGTTTTSTTTGTNTNTSSTGTSTTTSSSSSTTSTTSSSSSSNTSTTSFNSSTRVFRLVQDLTWVNMVTSSATGWNYGADTIQTTNVTDTGFTVIWVSQSSETSTVNYGTSTSSLSTQAYDERDGIANKGSYYVHSVSVSQLQPSTKYYFKVVSGSNTYTNDGNYYSVTTFSTLSSTPTYVSITGVVSNLPSSKEGIVVAYIKDADGTGSSGSSSPISALVDEDGKWLLSIANSRKADGSAYFEYTSSDSMYFNVASTTISPSTLTVSMNGITGKSITITLPSSTTTNAATKLTNYGVI